MIKVLFRISMHFILTLRVEENNQYFIFYSGKDTNMSQTQRIMKKVLQNFESIKRCLYSFIPRISHWVIFHSQAYQLRLITIKWRYYLRIINIILHTREPTYSYPNQTLKTIFTISSFHRTKWLMWISTASNWTTWSQPLMKSIQN